MTERRKDGMTERQKDRQGKSSIAPTFSKRGYKNWGGGVGLGGGVRVDVNGEVKLL